MGHPRIIDVSGDNSMDTLVEDDRSPNDNANGFQLFQRQHGNGLAYMVKRPLGEEWLLRARSRTIAQGTYEQMVALMRLHNQNRREELDHGQAARPVRGH